MQLEQLQPLSFEALQMHSCISVKLLLHGQLAQRLTSTQTKIAALPALSE
jgi:hypothetical protein